ncbi:zf-HC2 domain-containing protein [Acidipila sp. EB88]|uniref:zf-HC2 domain-containing protein n=1 Tax=Acidipila sp. EB88 TaxID=2305226 RepID=UPI000F5E6001|nr:zf-HC2 domain-containing protein [Acidipila sp. EB88]RRA48599.1 anti-sigma factor [Acidipila sp. EB88]
MTILLCTEVEEQFSSYLDGTLSGVAMADMEEHLRHCAPCTHSFAEWRATVDVLGTLGPAKPPSMLALQLRVAISQQQARTPRAMLAKLRMTWRNSFAPLAVQASAGLASAVLMLGALLLLVGTLAAPEPAAARDEPIGMASPPRLLYASLPDGSNPLGTLDGSVVVRVFVDAAGRVYDYRVLSGVEDKRSQSALANEMMWSVFVPAHVFGEPVRGSVILSLAGVSVPG